VAILDTGLGAHPWFPKGSPLVDHDPTIEDPKTGRPVPVGLRFPAAADPEHRGVSVDTLNATLDAMAGHGTFVAGVVRQHSADATLVIVPVMYGDGAADETDVIEALEKLFLWNRLRRQGRADGPALDVVSLSFGYYHETPGSVDDEAGLFAALRALQRDGVCIVAAAGNGATTLPFWPAALSPLPVTDDTRAPVMAAPLVSVGATNPGDPTAIDQATVAAFSNTGPWVRVYRCGVAVVSTMPTTLNSSQRPDLHVDARPGIPARGTPDPDDYACGFGVWSGSSFSAPAFAGQVAAALAGMTAEADAAGRVAQASKVVDSLPPGPRGVIS